MACFGSCFNWFFQELDLSALKPHWSAEAYIGYNFYLADNFPDWPSRSRVDVGAC
jgi:hypothetical protein